MLHINTSSCSQCGLCEKICPSLAINYKTGNIAPSCISCFQCVSVCPSKAITKDNLPVQPLSGKAADSDSLALLIKKRRSHRHFKNQSIPKKDLEDWLEKLRFSPTASNGRNIHITLITDEEKIKELNDKTRDELIHTFKKVTSPLLRPILKPMMGRLYSKIEKYKIHFLKKSEENPSLITYNAPVVVLAHMPSSMMGLPEMDCNIWAAYGSLLAESQGWGTCFNGYIVKGLNKDKDLKIKLGIPKNHKIFSCLLMGYPTIHFSNEIIRDSFPVNWQ